MVKQDLRRDEKQMTPETLMHLFDYHLYVCNCAERLRPEDNNMTMHFSVASFTPRKRHKYL